VSSRNKRTVFLAAWVIALAAAASIPALALVRGAVWIGPGAYIAHGRLTHPLLSIGAPVTLTKGSSSMVISILGPVYLSGRVKDDVAGIGSPIYVRSGASIQRDVVSLGESVYRAAGVTVEGRVGGQMVPWDGRGSPGDTNWLIATWRYSGLSFAAGLALLLICTCIALAFPWQTVMVANYLHRDLARSVVAGLMGLFLFLFLVVPLGLSLFGLPFALLIAVAAAAAWLLGLTSAAVVTGRRLAALRKHDAGLLWVVVSGMFAIALAGAIPWLGVLIVGLAGATGAGGLALAMIARARPAPVTVPFVIPEEDETFSSSSAYVSRGRASVAEPHRDH
jgi:hypothetical protein